MRAKRITWHHGAALRYPMGGLTVADLKKGARITGSDRNKLASEVKKQYEKGRSIRELADSHGRSYGFIHRLLSENEVSLRSRGGATRGKKNAS